MNKYWKIVFVIIILTSLFLWGWGLLNVFSGFQSIGLGFISMGFAVLSLSLAVEAKIIAIESDNKMASIGKGNFMRIDSNLKTITQNSINHLNETRNRWMGILSWRTGLIEAERIKKFANDGERDSIVFPFITMMREIPWGDNRLRSDNRVSNAEVDWIISIYKSIRHLNPSNQTLGQLQQLFYDNIAQLQDGENFNQLLDRIQAVVQQHPNELFQRIE